MITLQGAGAIVASSDGSVLLVRTERRGMQRWELPTAIRKDGESLLLTVFRCVEEESSFRLRVRIGRPICLALHTSEQLEHSYFAMFFECTAEATTGQRRVVPDVHADLPPTVKQSTIEFAFVEWRKVKARELHPQHRMILEQWAKSTSGTLFAVMSDADREVEFYKNTRTRTSNVYLAPPTLQAPAGIAELKWIHVSDIHFGDDVEKSQATKRLVLEGLLKDVRAHWGDNEADAIFVTGDVAFSAQPSQYEESLGWLTRLAEAAGVGLDRVWLVPGNHDVQRDLVNSDDDLRALHRKARKEPKLLDDFLSESAKTSLLQTKLQTYCTWLLRHFTHITSPLDWSTLLTTRSSRSVLLAGLCTVWISDRGDGKPQREGIWSNNMFVSRDRSLSVVEPYQDTAELTLLLTHHPPQWLCQRSTQWLDMLFGSRAVVHLCGHVHQDSAGVLFSMGDGRRNATIVAGAVHEGEAERHGYSWGQLRSDRDSKWHLGWAPRIWAGGRFTADSTNYPSLDREGYCWEPLA